MTTISAPAATAFLSALLFATALPAQTAAPDSAAGVSKVRIVRLSEVKGAVVADTGRGFETAMTNLPIVENTRISTQTGVAEVEFEDNSTLRLGPDSEVAFPTLERLATGATVSSVQVLKGTAYVSLEKTPGNEFDLLFGLQKLALSPASHVRLQMEGTEAKLAVLGGTVRINGASGVDEVAHKRTITFDLQQQSQPTVAKDVQEEPLDSWDHESADYHERVATLSGFNGGAPYGYGMNDLAYYGSFMSAGGCGEMWRPYFASAAWDPYANGAWAWYGGAGYSWVSPYPWGWMPYHYGSWAFCPGMGWGWQPGGAWYGVNNTAMMGNGVIGGHTVPTPPRRSPRLGEPAIVAVNTRPLVRSELTPNSSFVFRKDSAGLGIPRQTLGKLSGFSRQANEHGFANTPVYMTYSRAGVANGRLTPAGMGSVSIHRGYSAPAGMAASRGEGEMGGGRGGSGVSSGPAAVSSPSMSGAHGGGAVGGGGSHGH